MKKYNFYFKKLINLFFLYNLPSNLSYWWNFGSLAGFFLIMQIISGFLLSFWYIPHPLLAFNSVEFIRREVNYGWLFRYIHSNGASFFFLVVFIHRARTFYFSSYFNRLLTWFSGFFIFIFLILIAFFGYVLPWGQRSFWAATVITSLVSILPYIGNDLLLYLWGGFSIDLPTLSRFYSLHFLFPFILCVLVALHLFFLHEEGSSDPLGSFCISDKITFHPFYTIKDIVGIWLRLIIFIFFIFFLPNFLAHPINYIEADPEVTPLHIVPEWYFLPFYGRLRSVPSKIGGVLCLILFLLVICFFPFINFAALLYGSEFRPIYKILVFILFLVLLLIGSLGGLPIEPPYFFFCQFRCFFFFFLVLIIFPFYLFFEKIIILFIILNYFFIN